MARATDIGIIKPILARVILGKALKKTICPAEYKCDKYERTTHHTTRPIGVIRRHFWIENLNLRFQRNSRKEMSHTADKMSKVKKKVYSAALTVYKVI